MTAPTLTPEMLERFRQTGIRLDREGRLWHEGAEIEHAGLRRAILRWLDHREGDGRPILRLDARRYAYIDVEDAPLLVTALRWDGDRATVTVNDGTEEPLAYATVTVQASDNALYCRVREGRIEARITTRAAQVLSRRIDEDGDLFVLHAAGQRFAIAPR
ncbi:MAG TPA: hypothetical protein VFG83_09375 [Kofleriaceae bacterium]|nr:hypothetical protein [Kofleriaceae bacterium]